MFFFFKQKTAYEMRISDWSSDVGSSDLVEDALVIIAVTGQLVPRSDDALDQRRIAFGDPAQCEEGPCRARIGENVQHRVAIRLDPAFERRPVGAVDRALKGAEDRKSTRLNSSH